MLSALYFITYKTQLILDGCVVTIPGSSRLPPFATATPMVANSGVEIYIIALIIAIGGLLLLTAAGTLTIFAGVLYMRRAQPEHASAKQASPIVPEPEMPVSIETEVTFSTGEPTEGDPDNIATEVFVRNESIPPDDVETLDELPGILIAKTKPK